MRTKNKTNELLKRDDHIPNDSEIYLENLSFGYDDESLAVQDVSFSIKKGEYVSIIGHNGSGKSTLSKLIDGILVQNKGDIYIDGIKRNDDNALLLRKKIALVFQNPDSQFIGATVRDDIAFGLENECVPTQDRNAIIEKIAKEVGREEYLDREPSNLSGGQKQRVAIADCIARHPEILIRDEAGARLDPKGKHEIRKIIYERKQKDPNLTILNITHEIDEAYDSDRVLVRNKGKLVLDGTPEEVFQDDAFLASIHLDIPFAHKLNKKLKELGLDYGKVKNDYELREKICQSH